ncbi:MAG: type II toxin-antitoxin system HipA family toxin [Phycisphaerae bacterium]|nr:type II toxin-antitoxin system HipA family toxin [Phycisphaerae bacterium]
MKKLEVRLSRSPGDSMSVGQLAEAEHRIYFEYAPAFLETGWQLSPFKFPLKAGLIEHVDRSFGPLPGLFDDSLPDAWGLLLMDRGLRLAGLDPDSVSPLERLSWLGTRTMGALTYHPPAGLAPGDRIIDLGKMAMNAQALLAGETREVLPELLRAGGSPGGTRPKVLVGLKGDEVISGEENVPEGYEHWIVKFASRQETRDAGPIEYAYAQMAIAAGIDVPPVRLLEVSKRLRCFAIRRFDRGPGNRRLHVHAFGGLIHADFRIPGSDYADLLKVTSLLTRNQQDIVRVFRRMAFNVAAHNRDDHVKNFAFVMDEHGEWSLSPAYDLVYAPGPGGEHTMTVAGEGRRPTAEQCLKLAGRFGIRKVEVETIFEQVSGALARWARFADEAGCTKRTARQIADQFVVL